MPTRWTRTVSSTMQNRLTSIRRFFSISGIQRPSVVAAPDLAHILEIATIVGVSKIDLYIKRL